MQDMQKKIANHWTKIDINSKIEVTYLFVNIRNLLEKNNLKKQYPTLNFYCNWLVHTELDHSSCPLIKQLMLKIAEHFEFKTSINDAISQLLNISTLKQELLQVLASCNIDIVKLKTSTNFDLLITTLLTELIDKPLKCEKVNINSQLKELKDINGIKLIEWEGVICWELLSPNLHSMNSRIIGQLIKLLD